MSERPQPLKAINKFFEGKEPWQIVTMTASSVLALMWAHSLYNAKESVTTRLRKEFFRWLRRVPLVRRKIEEKMAEVQRDFRRDVTRRLAGVTVRRQLPDTGLAAEQVLEEVKDHLTLGAYDWKGGSVSGAVYHVQEELARVAGAAYSLAAYTNPLHADVFPGVNKMEAEIVRMAIQLFHGDEQCCGTVTTGGTESIMMACKAFRDLAYSRGVSQPQMIVATTAHTAFDKAAQYLGIAVRTVPVCPRDLTIDVDAVRRAIGRRTCMIVGSAPNYPYGTMDDIVSLSALAAARGVPLHVDACLGGFVAAFMPAAGHAVPPFDFTLPGVASISADTHKYGFAPKGTSVVLYRRPEYRHHQYTVTTEWPGGVYGSPTVNGSRAGGLIAACWATMMFVGRRRYVAMTDEIITTARYLEDEFRKIEGLFIFGKPATTVVALGSTHFDIFRLADLLHKKGWSLNALQFPSGIHICVTHAHTQAGVAARLVADVRDAAETCLKDCSKPVEGKMAIYGVAQEIADRSLVGDITRYYIDSMYYLPPATAGTAAGDTGAAAGDTGAAAGTGDDAAATAAQ